MRSASQDIPDRPTVPDAKTRKLRAKLIFEEALETIKELGVRIFSEHDRAHALDHIDDFDLIVALDMEPNLEGIADGCADISVVTIGTLSACGMADDSLLKEVDTTNLRKFENHCPKCDEPGEDHNSGIPGERACRVCHTTWISGYRRDDGKWVKPANHPAPDIAGVLKHQVFLAEAVEAQLEENE